MQGVAAERVLVCWLVLVTAAVPYCNGQEDKTILQVTDKLRGSADTSADYVKGDRVVVIDNIAMINIDFFSTRVKVNEKYEVNIRINGSWLVQNVHIPIEVRCDHNRWHTIKAEHTGDMINLVTLTELITKYKLATLEQGVPLAFNSLQLSGVITPQTEKRFTIKSGDSASKVFIIFNENTLRRATTAVAAEYTNGIFSVLIHQLTNLDIAQIPCFGKAVFTKFAYSYYKSSTNLVIDDINIFRDTHLLRLWGNTITEGLTGFVQFDLWRDTNFMIVHNEGNVVLYPRNGFFPLYRLNDCFKELEVHVLPISTGRIDDMSISSIILSPNTPNQVMSIIMDNKDRVIGFFHDFICFKNVSVNISVSAQRVLETGITGDILIGSTGDILHGTVSSIRGNYILKLTGNTISRETIHAHFNAVEQRLPNEFYSWFRDNLDQPTLIHRPVLWPNRVHIRGQTTMYTGQVVKMEALINRVKDTNYPIDGLEINDLQVANFLERITPYNFDSIRILQKKASSARITLSSTTVENTDWNRIPRGLFLRASMHFPDDCSSDRFCNLINTLFKSEFQLTSNIVSLQSFPLEAELENVEIDGGIGLSDVNLLIDARHAPTPIASITATARDNILDVNFKGTIRDTRLELNEADRSLVFLGGIITVLNIRGSTDLGLQGQSGRREYFSEIQMTGSKCSQNCPRPIVTSGIIGVEPGSTPNVYCHTTLPGEVTLPCLLCSLGIPSQIHWPLQDSKFTRDLFLSISRRDTSVLASSRNIPGGVFFHGTLEILCQESQATATYAKDSQTDASMQITLPFIDIREKLFVMAASATDTNIGPTFTINLEKTRAYSAVGHYKVLGNAVDSNLVVDKDGYRLDIPQGKIRQYMTTNLRVHAPQGCIRSVNYMVNGEFSNDLYHVIMMRIEREFSNFIVTEDTNALFAFDPTFQHINNAIAQLNRAHQKLRTTQEHYCTADNTRRNISTNNDYDTVILNLQQALKAIRGVVLSLGIAGAHVTGAEILARQIQQIIEQELSDPRLRRIELDHILLDFHPKIHITFNDVSLDDANRGIFVGTASFTYTAGQEHRFAININLDDIGAMARQIAEHVGNGFGFLF